MAIRTKQHSLKSGSSDARYAEKEKAFKDLTDLIEQAGYKVRREKLKQGHGWKVVSGQCRLASDQVVFVDRKASLDDQLFFLISTAEKLGVQVDNERYRKLMSHAG
ncbi:MAG: hypothetical protein DCC75_08750 [Proteobacteria bacterium]|nr:MAG: hypothetical protein DCC75_08750 [Pseudomonadota bacterium]